MQRLYIFYKRLCTIKLYFVNFFFSFASSDPTLSLIILPRIRVSRMMHWPTMLVAPFCTIELLGLRLAKSSSILSEIKGLIITVAAYSTPPRELLSLAHNVFTSAFGKGLQSIRCLIWRSRSAWEGIVSATNRRCRQIRRRTRNLAKKQIN